MRYCLGGDGTLIQAAHDLKGTSYPLIGINLGNLGYLSEVDQENLTVTNTRTPEKISIKASRNGMMPRIKTANVPPMLLSNFIKKSAVRNQKLRTEL